MTALLTELKTRARLQRNAARCEQPQLRLRDGLHQAARDVGFAHWDHGRRVMGGHAVPGDGTGPWLTLAFQRMKAPRVQVDATSAAEFAAFREWALRRTFLVQRCQWRPRQAQPQL